MNTISLQEAVAAMRRDTANGKPFEIKFLSYSLGRKKSGGIKLIPKCLLRAVPPLNKDGYGHEKLYLFDTNSHENRQCWQVLILSYNGQQISLR
tara:strand:+ start:432 stop:713 length:282 start_codon:yes stop_codon:yes gene_type:complete